MNLMGRRKDYRIIHDPHEIEAHAGCLGGQMLYCLTVIVGPVCSSEAVLST
jgi:hypothetical protein